MHNRDNNVLRNLCGPLDENLQQLREILGVDVRRRGSELTFLGGEYTCDSLRSMVDRLLGEASHGVVSAQTAGQILMSMRETQGTQGHGPDADDHGKDAEHRSERVPDVTGSSSDDVADEELSAAATAGAGAATGVATGAVPAIDLDALTTIELPRIRGRRIEPRSANQAEYVNKIVRHPISFGIGPAGTGKTFLAVACAVSWLLADKVERLLLVRPAVEAGERLGFLPGDISQKVDPYLRPLYDALYEMLGSERTLKLMERNRIEVAPLAFMRGRTLNHSFVILDEAQNTTTEQMKMFLTRLGFNSKMVVTGDLTQIDLPNGKASGLRDALERVSNVEDIGISRFQGRDIVRHPIVQSIVDAYDR